ncbi:hypothetical protein DPEC_G00230520 [Dallia pectoralis]|uniref:Uncharacterized protein n=1 Tax=Dallia pectoralis TaxID=75939 RepID=A0ACC2G1H8_DALPE|nr:hypothetical protein DPEC_G00230520 [Dallia pectoralis]
MDPAELQKRWEIQEKRMDELLQLLHAGAAEVTTPSTVSPRQVPPISMPTKYDGEPGKCQVFLLQAALYMSHNRAMFSDDRSRVDFTISLLTGRALDWATALWAADVPELNSEAQFKTLFREVFDHPVSGRGVGDQLCELKQGNRTVADYALEFRTLAAGCGWSETALLTVYRRGLRPEVQTELACPGDITVLNEFINISISIDNLLVNHKSSAVREVSSTRPRWAAERRREPEEEPMQLGRSPLQPSVRQQRRRDGLCLYCGQSGHFIRHCPVRPSRTTEYLLGTVKPVSETHVFNITSKQMYVPVTLAVGEKVLLPVQPPLRVNALDGEPMGTGLITHRTEELNLQVGSIHNERITMFVISAPGEPLVLGHPWLVTHDPVISWR